ncbi:MAG: glycosyltransferase [Patescibacteria group bacterium]|nr:glycosyltransferase [Patescibacteria group bacterium]
MRIAVFIKSTTFNKNYGGLETQNKLLCEGLVEAGHEVVVIAPAPENHGRGELRPISQPPPTGRERFFLGRVENPDLSELTYYFLDAPAGKYSKKWFRVSTRLFKELHEKNPFDAVILQSMAGQRVIGYLKARKFSTAAGEALGASAEPAPGAGECGGETLLKELSKEKAGDSPKSGFKTGPKAGLFSSPACIVIQHGTILGELKTRWKSLCSNSKYDSPAGGRSPKQVINYKLQTQKHLGFRNSDLFGASNLVFRVFNLLKQLLFFFFRLVPYGIKIYIQDQIRLRRADKVIAVSDLVKESLVKEYFLPEEKVEVIYNGIEIDKFEIRNTKSKIRKELEVGEDNKVLLYVGRIEKEKGLGKLLRAVSNIKSQSAGWQTNFKLIIVGDGKYLGELKKLAGELGIADKVIFTGKVPYEDVPKYYAAADVFVLPSLRQEGLPMTLPEAMASGLPVVASKIGGIPNAVEDGKTGFLVEPGNVEELSEELIKVLKDDKLREHIGEEARGLAKEKFSQESMVKETISVISNSISERENA